MADQPPPAAEPGLAPPLGVRKPSLLDALAPIVALIGLIALTIALFGVGATDGPLQVALLLSAAFASLVAFKNGYVADVLPSRMFREEFERRGLAPQVLSRAVEDSGMVTSVLVPWNTCGAYISGVLGVPTAAYLPFCFFNILSPILDVIYGYVGFKAPKLLPSPPEGETALSPMWIDPHEEAPNE